MANKYPNLGKILKKLLFEKDIKPIDLSKEVSISQPTLHRLIAGKTTRPYKSSLQPIADYFGISVEQLVGEESFETAPVYKVNKKIIRMIPLLAWHELPKRETLQGNPHREVAVTDEISEKAFALVMPDSSMEPVFSHLSILIFDPVFKPTDRSYVLIKLNETNRFIFRQLIIDVEHRYFKSIHPDLNSTRMGLLDPKDEIIACLVESRNNYMQSNMSHYIEGSK